MTVEVRDPHSSPHSSRSRRLASGPFILLIRVYQVFLGPLMGGHCRFEPTCSRYAIEAYQRHGPIRGTWLTLRRLFRCHPFGGHGYDPVPLPPSSGPPFRPPSHARAGESGPK